MAGDWIKVEKTTPDKPELMAIAHICNVTIEQAFAAWFRFYAWADSQTADGFVRFLSAKDADRIGTIVGLGSALEAAGWLTFTDEGCQFSNWERHNGESAKRRAMDSDRKNRKRSEKRPQNVRNDGGQNEDQRREEKRYKEMSTSLSPAPSPNAPLTPISDESTSVIPTADQVRTYAEGIGYRIDAEKFVDHYGSTGWRAANGQVITNWKAVVRKWKVNDESKRHQESLGKRAAGNGLAPGQVIHDDRPETQEAIKKLMAADAKGLRGY